MTNIRYGQSTSMNNQKQSWRKKIVNQSYIWWPPFCPGIPYILQFWYTTTLFRTLKVHQKVHRFATKYAKIAQTGHNMRTFRILFAEKYIDLKQNYTAAGGGDGGD